MLGLLCSLAKFRFAQDDAQIYDWFAAQDPSLTLEDDARVYDWFAAQDPSLALEDDAFNLRTTHSNFLSNA